MPFYLYNVIIPWDSGQGAIYQEFVKMVKILAGDREVKPELAAAKEERNKRKRSRSKPGKLTRA